MLLGIQHKQIDMVGVCESIVKVLKWYTWVVKYVWSICSEVYWRRYHMAPIACTVFLIAPQALQVLWMKPNTKDISGNFSRKIANTSRIYCSSQPSMVHWLSSSIFPCLVVPPWWHPNFYLPQPPNQYIFWKLMIIAIQKWIGNTNTKTKTKTMTKTPRE